MEIGKRDEFQLAHFDISEHGHSFYSLFRQQLVGRGRIA